MEGNVAKNKMKTLSEFLLIAIGLNASLNLKFSLYVFLDFLLGHTLYIQNKNHYPVVIFLVEKKILDS